MSAIVKKAGQPRGVVRLGSMRFVIGAAFVVSVAAGGFAVGRANSDRQEAAVDGEAVSAGTVYPERGTIVDRRTKPGIPGRVAGKAGPAPTLTQQSKAAIRDRQRHHTKRARVFILTPDQALKDCQIHPLLRC